MSKKKVFMFLLAAGSFLTMSAQNMDLARKMYFYERYKTAKAEFEKAVAGTPGNADAHYWLTLTNLMWGKREDARKAAQAGLAATNNHPLLLVAMGHVELSEGKKEDARSRFETAISLADKKTQATILNAVGRAHGSVSMRYSDPDYGIEKLTQASQKEPKNSDIYINLGDCYRRKLDGGNAIKSYEQALSLDPANARGAYKSGLIYKTQDNCDVLKANFIRATNIDANFMPAWRELFDTYSSLESNCYNLAEARTYFEKYTSTTDQGFETDMLKMRFAYASKDFNTALSEANNIATKYPEDGKTEIPKWRAFIYEQMADSLNAVKNLEEFFVKETNPENIDPSLYNMAGRLYSKIPGMETKAIEMYEKYMAVESNKTRQLRTMILCAGLCEKMKDNCKAGEWYEKIIASKETASAYDYFKAGYAYFQCENYTKSAAIFTTYSEKYPADWRGPFWTGRSYAVMDTTMELGTAVPHYEKFLPLGEPDAQAKASVISVYRYLFIYHLQIKRDKAAATAILDKFKALDPANENIPKLEAYLSGGAPPRANSGQPAAGTGTEPKTTPAAGTNNGTKTPAAGTTKPAAGTGTKPATTKPAGSKPAAKKPVKKKLSSEAMV